MTIQRDKPKHLALGRDGSGASGLQGIKEELSLSGVAFALR